MDHNDIRAAFTASDDKRDAGLTTPPEVARRDDIPYGPHGRWNLLDVYRPRSAGDEPLPVIVSVHGGGWVYGDKDRYQYYCMDLCRRGFAVVNFSYRLAPEHPFPAAVEDTNAAFVRVEKNAAGHGLDLDRLYGQPGQEHMGHVFHLDIRSPEAAACNDEQCDFFRAYM